MSEEIIDRSAARAALIARYRDVKAGPPFPDAVSVVCDGCNQHIIWTTPPVPNVPTFCRKGCGDVTPENDPRSN